MATPRTVIFQGSGERPVVSISIESKADNIFALQEGLFGNAPRQWQTMDEVANEFGDKPVVVRPRVAGGRCWYEIGVMEWFLEYYRDDWFNPAEYYFSEPIAQDSVTLNAEITRLFGDVFMTFATTQQHMRPALKEAAQYARGLRALTIMRHLTCDRGRQTIEELLDEYPDHVIEFTCMTEPYGTLGWKTVVWEVRNY